MSKFLHAQKHVRSRQKYIEYCRTLDTVFRLQRPYIMDTPEHDIFIDQIVAVIDEMFIPVDNLRELEETITTDDLLQAVYQFYPSKDFDSAMLVKSLNDFGFKFTTTHSGALQFIWLMKKR